MPLLDTPVAGLPLDSWLLLVVAVGAGLALELAFYRARRRGGSGGRSGVGSGGRRGPDDAGRSGPP